MTTAELERAAYVRGDAVAAFALAEAEDAATTIEQYEARVAALEEAIHAAGIALGGLQEKIEAGDLSPNAIATALEKVADAMESVAEESL